MTDVVFILGAGASKQCGAPVMAEFLDVALDLFWREEVSSRQEFESVFRAISSLQNVHSKAQLDLNNIESVFTALELGKVIRRVPGLRLDQIEDTISALKVLIVETIEETMLFPIDQSSNKPSPPAPYRYFCELLHYLREKASPKLSVSVITFNYDIGLDFAMAADRIGPDYIIERPKLAGGVKLMKLHGSLNWATDTSGNIYPADVQEYVQRNFFHSSPGSKHGKKCAMKLGSKISVLFSDKQVNKEPVIVPPSWNKTDYHTSLSAIWAEAASCLSQASYIFVLGYSLPATDSFFRHLYALGSEGDKIIRGIVIFNPDVSGDTDRRFQELLGPAALARYSYISEDFATSMQLIKRFFERKAARSDMTFHALAAEAKHRKNV